jgi:dTDP-4-dehydrorhamnose 3,5-epimerase
MIFTETPLAGAFLIDLQPNADARGFHARMWCEREFEAHHLVARIAQTNVLLNHQQGTLRGLHYQTGEAAEAKVFRCVRGAVYDVIVDMREESPSYRQWFGVELAAGRHRMLYVPQRFAQGFITLTDETELLYQTSAFYTPGSEAGIRYDDPAFKIEWPMTPVIISDKDTRWPDFSKRTKNEHAA